MSQPDESPLLKRIAKPAVILAGLMLVAGIMVACSSYNTNSSGSGTGTVNVMLSDPASCATPNGPFAHVYVTITDVQVNTSSTASANDSGWVDLTPNLSKSPKQVDLLGQANNQCFLAQLGDNMELQAGTYQQIRLILADNSLNISGNLCGNSANCVMLSSDPTTPETLDLSSEAQTGIKIPSGQIANGGFTIGAGQTKDLDIDFLTCESIVQEGNGQFRLKPVLHAGEVSTTASSINGTVKLNGQLVSAVANGAAWVTLEQSTTVGNMTIDRPVTGSVKVDPDGTFVFCPVNAGTYDVVIVGEGNGVLYAPAIITGVSVGSTLGTVSLNLPPTTQTLGSAATLSGMVSTAGTSGAIAETISLSVLETVNNVTYTIPQLSASSFGQTSMVTTANPPNSGTCANGTDCYTYSLPVSATGAMYAAWSMGGTYTLAPASTTTSLATYTVDGYSANCSTTPSDQFTNAVDLSTVTSLTAVPVTPTLAFTGCS